MANAAKAKSKTATIPDWMKPKETKKPAKREPKAGEIEVMRLAPKLRGFEVQQKNKDAKELKPGLHKKKK